MKKWLIPGLRLSPWLCGLVLEGVRTGVEEQAGGVRSCLLVFRWEAPGATVGKSWRDCEESHVEEGGSRCCGLD